MRQLPVRYTCPTILVFSLVAIGPAWPADLTGKISIEASVEPAPMLSVAVDSFACGKDGKILDPRLEFDEARGLANVVVTVLEPHDSTPPPADDEAVSIEQKGCVFMPHVSLVAPGQEVRVSNDDEVFHNFRTRAEANKPVNLAQPKGREISTRLTRPEIVPVTCDVHHWMSAILVVMPHRFVAVTAKDGSFRIEGLEPGSYTVELWHETLGTRRADVVVTDAGGNLELTLSPPSEG